MHLTGLKVKNSTEWITIGTVEVDNTVELETGEETVIEVQETSINKTDIVKEAYNEASNLDPPAGATPA